MIAERIHFAGNAPHDAQTPAPTKRAHANDTALEMSAAIGFSEQIWG